MPGGSLIVFCLHQFMHGNSFHTSSPMQSRKAILKEFTFYCLLCLMDAGIQCQDILRSLTAGEGRLYDKRQHHYYQQSAAQG